MFGYSRLSMAYTLYGNNVGRSGGAVALLASMKPRHESGIAEMPFNWLTMDRCILYRITRHSNDNQWYFRVVERDGL